MTTAQQLTTLVLDAPGVTTVFTPEPGWSSRPMGPGLLTNTPTQPGQVLAFSTDGGAAIVHIRIGVDDSTPAPETARRVAALIRHNLTTGAEPSRSAVNISVQISLITGTTVSHP